jgi:hypothetical protein
MCIVPNTFLRPQKLRIESRNERIYILKTGFLQCIVAVVFVFIIEDVSTFLISFVLFYHKRPLNLISHLNEICVVVSQMKQSYRQTEL